MEQHPVPQEVSSYQFKLVGDMTLKQFFQIAGGALIAIILYATNLHSLIKWPLMILSGLTGVALAFLPFQERPLERWIFAFFRSIYSPTLFSWNKSKTKKVFFQENTPAPNLNVIAPKGQEALDSYLSSSSQKITVFQALEESEKSFLSKLAGIFSPKPKAEVQEKPEVGTPPLSTTINIPLTGVGAIQGSASTMSVRPRIVVEEEPAQDQVSGTPPEAVSTVNPVGSFGGIPAEFSLAAAPPNPPTIPNTVTGQVFESSGVIVEGAILEVRDGFGRPVRALKTNKLGHFLIVTPLLDGKYEIITEKEGFFFDSVIFEASGSIIPPIAIKARPATTQEVQTQNMQQPITN